MSLISHSRQSQSLTSATYPCIVTILPLFFPPAHYLQSIRRTSPVLSPSLRLRHSAPRASFLPARVLIPFITSFAFIAPCSRSGINPSPTLDLTFVRPSKQCFIFRLSRSPHTHTSGHFSRQNTNNSRDLFHKYNIYVQTYSAQSKSRYTWLVIATSSCPSLGSYFVFAYNAGFPPRPYHSCLTATLVSAAPTAPAPAPAPTSIAVLLPLRQTHGRLAKVVDKD